MSARRHGAQEDVGAAALAAGEARAEPRLLRPGLSGADVAIVGDLCDGL